jgi:hypothetical protein
MVGKGLFCVSALFFFLAAVGSNLIPNPTAWGLVLLALGMAVGNWLPWRGRTP